VATSSQVPSRSVSSTAAAACSGMLGDTNTARGVPTHARVRACVCVCVRVCWAGGGGCRAGAAGTHAHGVGGAGAGQAASTRSGQHQLGTCAPDPPAKHTATRSHTQPHTHTHTATHPWTAACRPGTAVRGRPSPR
jgi:hypothetical protein